MNFKTIYLIIVIILLTSSGGASTASEGVFEQPVVVFTQSNYNKPKTVTVRDGNRNVKNGIQNYKIYTSERANYLGVKVANIDMKGITLETRPVLRTNKVMASFETTIRMHTHYTGTGTLSFALEHNPSGMTINSQTGAVSWTPKTSDEGKNFDIRVRVSDGIIFKYTSFKLFVVSLQPLNTTTQGNVLTVNAPRTNLNGLSITKIADSHS